MWVHRRPECVLVAEQLSQASQLHSHHSLQLSVGLRGPLHATLGNTALPPAHGILIASNVPHTLRGEVVHIFVEPLGPLGRKLRGILAQRPCLTLDFATAQRLWCGGDGREWLVAPPHADMQEPVSALLGALERVHGRPSVAPVDDRVGGVISTLQRNLEARVPLEELADQAHLSPTRLTHLFTQEVGMPIKQYVVWLRMLAVLDALASGLGLGTLAHSSGFPDQAAFNRTYRKMWGRTPSAFRQAARAR